MKTTFLILIIFTAKLSFAQLQLNWANKFFDPTIGSIQKGTFIEVDNDGNIWTAGIFNNEIFIDSSTTLTAISYEDIYVAKFNSNGELLLSFSIGGTETDDVCDIAIDNENNLYIIGTYKNYADFDPSFDVELLGPATNINGFVAKYDTNGNLIFAKSINSPNTASHKVISFDNKNNCYIGGFYKVNADIDPSSTVHLLTAETSVTSNIFITKWTKNGTFLIGGSIGNSSKEDVLYDIMVSNEQKVFCVGKVSGIVDFDLDSSNYVLGSTVLNKAFIAKFDTSLIIEKAHIFGGTGNNSGTIVKSDNVNNIIVGFALNGSTSYNMDSIAIVIPSFGGLDFGIATYDKNLNFINGNTIGGGGNEYITDLAIDAFNNIHVCGVAAGNFDADPSPDTIIITPTFDDGFLFEYDPSCNLMNSFYWVTTSLQRFNNLDINEYGDIYLTGEFTNQIKLDPDTSLITFSGSFSFDAFLVKYSYLNVGIEDFFIERQIMNVYPNPVNTFLNIDERITNYSIYNGSGSIVLTGNKNIIDISELINGLYILKANDSNGFQSKFIVQH